MQWNSITPEQYNLWKNHPVTLAMMEYYGDFAKSLTEHLLKQWLGDTLKLSEEHEIRGRVNTLEEMINQPYHVMRQFYGLEEVKDDLDAA
jgi:hypothetical protein